MTVLCSCAGMDPTAGGLKCAQAIAIGGAQGLVFLRQLTCLCLLRTVDVQRGDFLQGRLHGALAGLKLAPVLAAVGAVGTAQQHVLPLLHLGLELQVGAVDQAGAGQRAF